MDVDYIVVGAGAAGCVLADQLSARGVDVLVLEAGERDRTPNAKIPAAFSKMFKTKYDWDYETAPQVHMNERTLYWPRGKILGGSTSMNAMIYQRGHRATFDGWENAGNIGWGYGDLLPAFMAHEDQERGRSDFHGSSGPLSVADLREPNPLSLAFVDAAEAHGFARNADFNDDDQVGFGMYQVTQRKGARCSAATAFLKPALKRSNLTAKTGAHVTRVLIEDGRAVGVEYLHKSGRDVAYASREVILSGGAVNSPQLLMLSGIGPADHLSSFGIDVVAASENVGQNLIDHPAAGVCCSVRDRISMANAETPRQVLRYATKKMGMLSSNVGEAGGFITLGDGSVPDIQFHFAPSYFINHGFDSPETDGVTIAPTLVDPKSSGEIRLASADPTAAPVIDPRYFSDERDLWLLVEGCKLAREFSRQSPLADLLSGEYLPGHDVGTDDEWAEFVRGIAESLYHPVGTCAMGVDDESVVDPQLRVRGVRGLRVADASIMPTIINANTQATSMVIGQRAADFITA